MQKGLPLAIRRIKSWIKENKALDVIMFGSLVRGKFRPRDIDLCVLIKDIDEEKSIDLVDSLGKLTDKFDFNFHINILTSSSFAMGDTLTKTLLNEGHSVKRGKKFSSVLGFSPGTLFVYSLRGFSSSKRVKFHYMLRGRYGSEGVLKEVNGKFLGTGTILVSADKEDVLKEVFDKWDVEYDIKRILVS